MFRLSDEDPRAIEEVVPDEETKVDPVPTTKRAANPATWGHHYPSILNNCKTAHNEPVEPANWEGPGDWDAE